MTKGSRLSKRKRNVLFLSNMHYWPSARWSIWVDIWPNSCFCILLDFLKVLYFFFPLFFSWLVMPRDLVVRLFAARTHALKLASLLRTYERWICSKSSILFNETKSRPMNIYILVNMAKLSWFWFTKLSCCYLVSYEYAGHQDTDLSQFLAYPFHNLVPRAFPLKNGWEKPGGQGCVGSVSQHLHPHLCSKRAGDVDPGVVVNLHTSHYRLGGYSKLLNGLRAAASGAFVCWRPNSLFTS